MADYSAAMTIARAQLAMLRLQGLTLGALIERQVLTGAEAAALVRDAARTFPSPNNDPAVQTLLSGAFETVAKDLQGTPVK